VEGKRKIKEGAGWGGMWFPWSKMSQGYLCSCGCTGGPPPQPRFPAVARKCKRKQRKKLPGAKRKKREGKHRYKINNKTTEVYLGKL